MKKFLGRFRELIPAGYTFQKMYARNYRCYWKKIQYGDHIWIWQHLGGYVELNDYYGFSGLIIDAILREGDGEWALDYEDRILVPYNRELHDPTIMQIIGALPDIETDEGLVAYKKHTARWRRVGFEDRTIAEIQKMSERGWL